MVTVKGSTNNDGDYTISGANAIGPFVTIQVSPTPTLPIFDGRLSWTESFTITAIDRIKRTFKIGHNVSSALSKEDIITVISSDSNDGDYTILKLEVSGSNTTVYVKEGIPSDNISGDLTYTKSFEITGLASDSFTIRAGEDEQAIQNMIGFISKKFFTHEGMHIIEHLLLRPRINEPLFRDNLLPVQLDQDCASCQIKDPYSFVVTVVLPYWPDRFINMDFRNFMEKTLRKEAPAHVLLNICWIDCRQMMELENKFKAWLIETGKKEIDKVVLSEALSELIEILTKIRNVYPTGILHDCKEDENLEGAIILNNSVLGTF